MIHEVGLVPVTIVLLVVTAALLAVLFRPTGPFLSKTQSPRILAPALVFLLTLLATVLFVSLNVSTPQKDGSTSISSPEHRETSRFLQNRIREHIEPGLNGVETLALSWSEKRRPAYDTWSSSAQSVLTQSSAITSIRWLDNTFQTRWLERKKGFNYVNDLDQRLAEDYRILLRRASAKKITLFGPLISEQTVQATFTTFTPVHQRGRFDGFFLTTFDLTQMMKILQKEASASGYFMALKLNGETISAPALSNTPAHNGPRFEDHFTLFNQSWTVILGEKASSSATNFWTLDRLLILALGTITALALAYLTYVLSRRSGTTIVKSTSEEQLLHYMKNTPVAVAMFDVNMRYIQASDRWLQDYNLVESEVIGKSHYEIFPDVPINHPQWLEMHWQAINGNVIKSEEVLVVDADGHPEWLRYELHPWHDNKGELGGVIMLTENITERKTSEKLKDEFISNVNHELRTPLTSIQGALTLLKVKLAGDLDPQGRRLLEISYDNCIRLAELVNDFLDMEKIAAGKIRVDVKSEEMNKLVKDVVELNRPFASTNDVDLEFHSEIDEIYCDVDANRFNQALTNLISNAVKFTMRFDTVEIRLHQEQHDRVIISVIDNGPGIEDKFKEKIFEKFTQGDGSSTKAKDGSGLGLNITKSIINTFNGEVTLKTELNSGSTFSIVLPVHNPEIERQAA